MGKKVVNCRMCGIPIGDIDKFGCQVYYGGAYIYSSCTACHFSKENIDVTEEKFHEQFGEARASFLRKLRRKISRNAYKKLYPL